MLIFGGFVDGGERTNELWRFFFATNTWELIVSKEKVPTPRAGHSALLRGDTMVIFGGCDQDNEKLNDIWVYNIKASTWQEIHVESMS
jgi:N-acetylneuraminic acid mutarotase